MEELLKIELVAVIVGCLVGFNVVLSGVMGILESFMDKTESTADNKVHGVLAKIHKYIGLIR